MTRAVWLGVLLAVGTLARGAAAQSGSGAAGEYAKHFAALSQLSVEVAEAMPAEQYGFRPHPDSMDFGQLMTHIALTNFAFCAGLKDTKAPAVPLTSGKGGSGKPTEASEKAVIVKALSDSFAYCTEAIASLTEEQLQATHRSPDGRLPGREVLLAMYVHVAHHRGQAEIYLRDKGIAPPGYRI